MLKGTLVAGIKMQKEVYEEYKASKDGVIKDIICKIVIYFDLSRIIQISFQWYVYLEVAPEWGAYIEIEVTNTRFLNFVWN